MPQQAKLFSFFSARPAAGPAATVAAGGSGASAPRKQQQPKPKPKPKLQARPLKQKQEAGKERENAMEEREEKEEKKMEEIETARGGGRRAKMVGDARRRKRLEEAETDGLGEAEMEEEEEAELHESESEPGADDDDDEEFVLDDEEEDDDDDDEEELLDDSDEDSDADARRRKNGSKKGSKRMVAGRPPRLRPGTGGGAGAGGRKRRQQEGSDTGSVVHNNGGSSAKRARHLTPSPVAIQSFAAPPAATTSSHGSSVTSSAAAQRSIADRWEQQVPVQLASVFDETAEDDGGRPDSRTSGALPSSAKKSAAAASTGAAKDSSSGGAGGVWQAGQHDHHSWSFLHEKRKDGRGRSPDHPDFNPRTLFVPPAFLKDCTPAMQQWWQFKSQNFDTVLFFKVGKFYELFHMDADTGVRELDLIYMKGSKAHSGFPEIGYAKFAAKLVERGYTVARVEQTETPEMLKTSNQRAANGSKRKVVQREICSLLSKGTRTFCYLDDPELLVASEGRNAAAAAGASGAAAATAGARPSLLMAITERPCTGTDADADASADDAVDSAAEYGICIIDPVMSVVSLSQFVDDSSRSRLRTLLSTCPIAQAALDQAHCTDDTKAMLQFCAPGALVQTLRTGDEFMTPDATLQALHEGKYFTADVVEAKSDGDDNGDDDDDGVSEGMPHWPVVLRAVVNGAKDDQGNETEHGGSALALSALGGALWVVRRAMVDYDILSMKQFRGYCPPDRDAPVSHSLATIAQQQDCGSDGVSDGDCADGRVASAQPAPTEESSSTSASSTSASAALVQAMAEEPQRMVIDGVTLANLDILKNSHDGTQRGSLWSFMNRAKTPFGRRLLKDWLCRPLYRIREIERRLDAVEELSTTLSPEADRFRAVLKGLPDLERFLTQIHSLGSRHRSKNHPDSRAIMYEVEKYNKRKIFAFVSVLRGMTKLTELPTVVSEGIEIHSTAVRALVRLDSGGGNFPEMEDQLAFFDRAFDMTKAMKDGQITPRPGVDPDYDRAKERCAELTAHFDEYLAEQKSLLRCNELKYWGRGSDRYQIEVPARKFDSLPGSYAAKSQKKGFRRFHTPWIVQNLAALERAETELQNARLDQMRRVFERFDRERDRWTRAIQCAALLDALLALAEVSALPNYCRPKFHAKNTQTRVASTTSDGDTVSTGPFMRVTNGRHATLEYSELFLDKTFIPNDTLLGGVLASGEHVPRVMLLSGPNMGGKSTLLRQTCLFAIMAQMGCFVPADELELTPVDRVFTRLGASDSILAGHSTFFVELSETASILHHATPQSLVILDELGRGTATFDGTAIAHAVVSYITANVRCRTLVATHYHNLVEEWGFDPRVQLGHMDCMVPPEDEEERHVTFLYKLVAGSSPKSYGINVARLARLPQDVIDMAKFKSSEFERNLREQQESSRAANTSGLSAGVDTVVCFDRLQSLLQSGGSLFGASFAPEAAEAAAAATPDGMSSTNGTATSAGNVPPHTEVSREPMELPEFQWLLCEIHRRATAIVQKEGNQQR